MDFKNRLKEEMAFSGIQHKELAKKANVKPRALLTYVASTPSMPPADVAVRLARVLGVSVEYLVTGERSKGEISQRERKLLQNFAMLTETERRAVEALIETLLEK